MFKYQELVTSNDGHRERADGQLTAAPASSIDRLYRATRLSFSTYIGQMMVSQ